VVKRGNSVAWPNGIVPYEIAPGYGKFGFYLQNHF
jgi:hypothetical protein